MWVAPLLALAVAAADPGPSGPKHPFVSAEGGETLGSGGAELELSAGFSRLSASYLQAASDASDWGAVASFDWLTTELVAGGAWRSLLWRSGATSLGWRAQGGLYADLGSTWALASNRSGTGIQLAPGLAISRRLPSGVLSARVDAPAHVTFDRGGGLSLALMGAVAYETPLWGDLAVGARAGGGALWSTSGAPFGGDTPRPILDVGAILTCRFF